MNIYDRRTTPTKTKKELEEFIDGICEEVKQVYRMSRNPAVNKRLEGIIDKLQNKA